MKVRNPKFESGLRMYCVVNQYITGIHAGIQSAHAIHEMFRRYPQRSSLAGNILWNWAEVDKTIIVLEGGYQSRLNQFLDTAAECSSYPLSWFNESEEALNGARTAVAIVLPEYMYAPQYLSTVDLVYRPGQTLGELQVANEYRGEDGNVIHNYTQPEKNLISVIKSFRLKGA